MDLRVLRDLWTEEGSRSVFAALVTQCARAQHPSARSIRPDPGDEGVDTYVGEFDGELRVYQAKYFCDGVGSAQQAQIRESWKQCVERQKNLVLWTLCLPIDLSVPETKWWQRWKKRASESSGIHIELWSKDDFVAFSTRSDLASIFDLALNRGVKHGTAEEVIAAMQAAVPAASVKRLPSDSHLEDALFVRKLEAAGVTQHRSARTAFYNFELLRASIEQGGNPDEVAALEDLQERVFDVWEDTFNASAPSRLGSSLFVDVNARIVQEDQTRLRTTLPAQMIHKKGALQYWADLCEAGWTADFKTITRRDGGDEE